MDTAATEEFQTTFLDESMMEGGFEHYVRNELGHPDGVDIPEPDSVPSSEKERVIDLARRVLLAGGNRTGFTHHTEVLQSMKSCDAEGVDCEVVRALAPSEIRFGEFEGDDEHRLAKANTVLAWADAEIDDEVLRAIEREQVHRVINEWGAAAECAEEQRQIEEFQQNPPSTINGWERFDPEQDSVVVAYRGMNHGVPVVAAVFENEDGELAAKEWTVDSWNEQDGNPREARVNRHPVKASNDHGPVGLLRSHLRTYDAEPIQEDDNSWPTSPA